VALPRPATTEAQATFEPDEPDEPDELDEDDDDEPTLSPDFFSPPLALSPDELDELDELDESAEEEEEPAPLSDFLPSPEPFDLAVAAASELLWSARLSVR
jgi:hypothetical protein